MSAIAKFAQAGGGLKNLAIGVAVIGGVIAAIYLIKKGSDAAAAVVDTLKGAGESVASGVGFITGTSQDSTLGTSIYDWLNPPQPYQTPEQFEAARAAFRLRRAASTDPLRVDIYG